MRSRFAQALLIAAGAHVALFLTVGRLRPNRADVRPQEPEPIEVTVEEAPPAPEAAPEPAAPSTTPTPTSTSTPNTTPNTTSNTTPISTGAGQAEGSSAPSPQVAPSSSSAEGWSASPWLVAHSGDWDAGAAWTVPTTSSAGAPPDKGPPAPTGTGYSRTGGLAEALAEQDLAKGYGNGGAVSRAAHDAAFRGAMADGTATIEIHADALGNVLGARIVDATSDRGLWEAVANEIVASLRAKPLRVHENGRGVAVRVRVDVAARLPAGSKGGLDLQGNGARFDLSNIGANKQRVVGVRVVSERPL